MVFAKSLVLRWFGWAAKVTDFAGDAKRQPPGPNAPPALPSASYSWDRYYIALESTMAGALLRVLHASLHFILLAILQA